MRMPHVCTSTGVPCVPVGEQRRSLKAYMGLASLDVSRGLSAGTIDNGSPQGRTGSSNMHSADLSFDHLRVLVPTYLFERPHGAPSSCLHHRLSS
mmetsp:Transcript_158552/g.504541  ORF Transcript_158552/g.504541 Transcript_158552/m.504541 type:complete len:95 (-) Transcript_158552:92-376(-)